MRRDEIIDSVKEEAENKNSTVPFNILEKVLCTYEEQEKSVSTEYHIIEHLQDMASLKRQSSYV